MSRFNPSPDFDSVRFCVNLRRVRFAGAADDGSDRFYLTDAPESLFPAGSDPLDCSELARSAGWHWFSIGDGSADAAADRVVCHFGSGDVTLSGRGFRLPW